MLSAVTAYGILNYSNYTFANTSNLYNFIISIFKITNEEDHKDIIEALKIHLGMQIYENFKQYIFKKYNMNHQYIKLFE